MFRHAARRVLAPSALRAAGVSAAPRATTPACPTLAARPFSTALSTPSDSAVAPAGTVDTLGSYDGYFEKDRVPMGDPGKREFTYFMLGVGRFAYASTARVTLLAILGTWNISADVAAMATTEFEVDEIEMGTSVTFKWRGKPVSIKRRTDAMIEREENVDPEELRDMESDEERCLKPEFVVVVSICTHLGCVPSNDMGLYDGWYCPCHGSHYDTSGRIRKGPAPLNLEIPPYKFLERYLLQLG